MNFEPLKEFLEHLTAWRIPGNSIVVTLKNREVFSYSSGYASLEDRIPMDGEKLLNIYSSSKVLTVTAAMQLLERGKFSLDDPLCEYLPEFREMFLQNGEKAKRQITMRHLFTMSAGFHYDRNIPAFSKARELTNGRMDTRVVMKCLAEAPLVFEPGKHYQYSFCHDVLAAAVEVISGKKFRNYVAESIFAPLGMQNSFFHNEAVRDRMAEQYIFESSDETDVVKLQNSSDADDGVIKNVGKDVGLIFGPEYDSGGAGVITSVSDFAKFVSALANYGMGANGTRILTKSSVELMRTPHWSAEHLYAHHPHPPLKGYAYGLGVRVMEDATYGHVGEFGWNGAAGSAVLADPEIGLSVFYAHHMINPQEEYYMPRLRSLVYSCLEEN